MNYLDSEKENFTVCLFRVKLDGTSEKPEKLKELKSYSSFIDVIGDWVIYMDSTEQAGFINLVNKNGKEKEIELYHLEYSKLYDKLDYSDEQVDSGNESENPTKDTVDDVEENYTVDNKINK